MGVGDFNGDGFADLAVAGYYLKGPGLINESGTVTILMNTAAWGR